MVLHWKFESMVWYDVLYTVVWCSAYSIIGNLIEAAETLARRKLPSLTSISIDDKYSVITGEDKCDRMLHW